MKKKKIIITKEGVAPMCTASLTMMSKDDAKCHYQGPLYPFVTIRHEYLKGKIIELPWCQAACGRMAGWQAHREESSTKSRQKLFCEGILDFGLWTLDYGLRTIEF